MDVSKETVAGRGVFGLYVNVGESGTQHGGVAAMTNEGGANKGVRVSNTVGRCHGEEEGSLAHSYRRVNDGDQ